MTTLAGPLEQISMRYGWCRAALERSVAAFGEEAVAKLAVELERKGSFARAESNAVDVISGLIGQELLGRQPPPLTERPSIFAPKESA